MQRRSFLKGTLAGGTVAVAMGAGLLSPRQVLAAWPESAFTAKSVNDAMGGLFGTADNTPSNKIQIKAPDIAENGAVVPVSVTTSLAATSIAIVAEKNGQPLAANFELSGSAKGDVATRIKMGKTSDVIAVVKSGGKLFTARKNVKVTIGGCGG
ncbi:MAG: thiosulfate oxidation carrier protein SoxY [Gammaproteobacteria bacterium]|nr:thiosulfate oxidation carrier protein SoxY [Gammaproteobacteria bacterium]MDH5650348.1 thiosulfate oxidation carrier protein SoxY [Gammaproteobacteria bacterium]